MEARVARLESDFGHLSRDIGHLEADMAHLKTDMTSVKADLRQVIERQDRDFRVLFGAIITVAVGLGGLMAKGFGWLG